MSLSKRALLLIFPVVLASYLLVAVTVYMAQRASVMGLEQARLSQQVNSLQALFEAQVTFNRSFIHSVVHSNSIRSFLSEQNETFRSNALAGRLQEMIKSLVDNPERFISVTVFKPDIRDKDFYFENSDDPFASITDLQITQARSIATARKVSGWDFLEIPGRGPLIVHSEFLDPLTGSSPLPSQIERAVLVQVAVQPDEFISLRNKLQAEYSASVELSALPLRPEGAFSVVNRLGPRLFLRLTPNPSYLDGAFRTLKTTLFGIGLALSLISLAMMLGLIRRFITGPVSYLDRQVTDVMSGRQDRILAFGGSGEIGRLSGNLKLMVDNLNRSLNRIQDMSWTDPLTGLANRTRFNMRGADMLEQAPRRSRFALLFIDLDNFKFVNDRYGHESGDRVLSVFSDRLGRFLTEYWQQRNMVPGLLSRLSGDEFAILMRVDREPDAERDVAAAIVGMFADGFEVDQRRYPVSASVGIAAFPDSAGTISQLISKADIAMYRAKEAGKNCWAFYSPDLEQRSERERLIQAELRIANPDEEFSLAFMPIVDRNGRVQRAEALLRWDNPQLGRVSPAEFIPIAESNGLFAKIDFWVIDRAMSHYHGLTEAFGEDFILSINMSSAELHGRDVHHWLEQCLKRHRINPRHIEIELTETFAADVTSSISQSIVSLRDIGLRLALDDFGVGYTSLRQLIEYPVDTIKLDLVIVRQLTETGATGVLASMIALCHARGLHVVAEGIDTEEKWDMLKTAGCDLFQGYLVSPPLPVEDLFLFGLKQTFPAKETQAETPVSLRLVP